MTKPAALCLMPLHGCAHMQTCGWKCPWMPWSETAGAPSPTKAHRLVICARWRSMRFGPSWRAQWSWWTPFLGVHASWEMRKVSASSKQARTHIRCTVLFKIETAAAVLVVLLSCWPTVFGRIHSVGKHRMSNAECGYLSCAGSSDTPHHS